MATLDFQIAPITEDHIPGFWAAVDSVARERKFLALTEGLPIEASRQFVLEGLRTNRPHFVAIHNSAVIGWCDISSKQRPVYAHVGVLGMGVLAEFRGRGVGQALITAAIDKARSIGLTRIELIVREDNRPAIALYEKIGFLHEGVKKNSMRIDGVYFNDLSMALLLPEP